MHCWCSQHAKLSKQIVHAGHPHVSVPKRSIVRGKWVQFVRRHRHDFKDPTSKYMLICLAHFEESCYEKNLALLNSMEAQGLKMNWCLKKDAVPTRETIVLPASEELSDRRKKKS